MYIMVKRRGMACPYVHACSGHDQTCARLICIRLTDSARNDVPDRRMAAISAKRGLFSRLSLISLVHP